MKFCKKRKSRYSIKEKYTAYAHHDRILFGNTLKRPLAVNSERENETRVSAAVESRKEWQSAPGEFINFDEAAFAID